MIKERYKTERMGSNGKVVYLEEGVTDGNNYEGTFTLFYSNGDKNVGGRIVNGVWDGLIEWWDSSYNDFDPQECDYQKSFFANSTREGEEIKFTY